MIALNKPQTLTKVGNLEQDLSETLSKTSFNFKGYPIPGVKKYCEKNKQKQYLIMTSQSPQNHPVHGYNIILTVTSYDDRKNKDLANKFQDETQIELRDPPEALEKMMESINDVFMKD